MPETTTEIKNLPAPKAETKPNLVVEVYTGTAEKTEAESSYVSASLMKPYNADELYQKTGDYSIYEEMVKDDQVSVCLRLKKDLVIGSGWDIVCKDEEQEEIKEDLQIALSEDPDYSFDDMLEEILTAYEFGFSLSEKVFKHRDDGSLTLKCLKTRHPQTWLIHTDKHGNIEKYEQRASRSSLDIEPKSLIHYVINRKFQNPYGTSDLQPAYAAWFTKRQVIRYYAIFLEKAASPIPVAKYDKNAPTEAVDDIYAAIKKFQTKTALAIPKDIEIEFLEAKNTGDAYGKAIDLFNMFIGRSLFVPDLLGLTGPTIGGGSYSLGKEQIAIFTKHINRRRKAIEDIINAEIIWPIVLYNFGFVDNYPKFQFKPISNEDAIEMAKIWLEAVKGRVFEPNDEEINYFRSLLKFPEGEIIKTELQQQTVGQQNGFEKEKETNEKPSEKNKEEKEKANDKKNFSLEEQSKFSKKVDFTAIERTLDSAINQVMKSSKPIIDVMLEDLIEQINKKRILQTGNVGRMETLTISRLKDLRLILAKSIKDVYTQSQIEATAELGKKEFERLPIPTDMAMEMLDAEIYAYIGDFKDILLKKTKVKIIAAIKDGKSISEIRKFIIEDLENQAEVSIERFARTKHTETMNRARLEVFEATNIVEAYEYNALIDSVTTDLCRSLHGKIFKAGTQPIPPLHWNCRSALVPITKYEDYEIDSKIGKQDISDYVDENKDQSFSTQ